MRWKAFLREPCGSRACRGGSGGHLGSSCRIDDRLAAHNPQSIADSSSIMPTTATIRRHSFAQAAATRSAPRDGLLGNCAGGRSRPQHPARPPSDSTRGSIAIQKAVALAGGLPARERSFITILAQRYRGTFADWKRDDAAYRQAMLQFARSRGTKTPKLLAAEALIESGGLTWQQGALASRDSRDALELVTNVLRVDPTNPMANHLCIHLYDLAPDHGAALSCAQRLDAATFRAGSRAPRAHAGALLDRDGETTRPR